MERNWGLYDRGWRRPAYPGGQNLGISAGDSVLAASWRDGEPDGDRNISCITFGAKRNQKC